MMQVCDAPDTIAFFLTGVHKNVGHVNVPRGRPKAPSDLDVPSFRNPPMGNDYPPALSAPIGHRSILAEVRAPFPPRLPNPVLQNSSTRAFQHDTPDNHIYALFQRQQHSHSLMSTSMPITPFDLSREGGTSSRGNIGSTLSRGTIGGTMSRGNIGGKSAARMDPFTWLSNVKVGERRGSSSGPGSGADSAGASRLSSRSRPPSTPDASMARRRSLSRNRIGDSDGSQSLQDEYVVPSWKTIDD